MKTNAEETENRVARGRGARAPKRTSYFCGLASLLFATSAMGATAYVGVGGDAPVFTPPTVTIAPGDTVIWTWGSIGFNHSVTSGTGGTPDGLFDSGIHKDPYSFSFTFPNPGTFNYYCIPHRAMGMTGKVIVEATAAPAQPLNISTRAEVRTDDQVLIGGFIVTGNDPKEVVLRAIGPSLTDFGITNALPDPILELRAVDGSLITMNDNWKDTQQGAIEASGFQPQSDLESAILTTLDPGNYTAIVRGKDDTTGVGLVEGYDLDTLADSQLANISTRGFVDTGNNVMIGGFILGGNGGNVRIVVRALGPSLTEFGVANALANPTLELRDANGVVIQSNDNWKDSQRTEIEATGLQPPLDPESAVLSTLGPGAYTAIVAGQGDLTGVGLVEVYRLAP